MKNKKTYYGFKMHALAGAVSKVILHVCTTAANVHDSRALEWVLNEEEDAGRTLYADSAYSGKNLEELTRSFKEVESQEIKDSLSHRAHLTMANAVEVQNGTTVFLNDDVVDTLSKLAGLYATGNSSLTVGLPTTTSVTITADFPVQEYAAATSTASVYANDSDITVNSVGTITLSSTNANYQAAGVYLNAGSEVVIGGEQTQSVVVKATSIATTRNSGDASTWGKTTSALWSEGGSLSLYGQKITLNASSAKSQTIGVFAKNSGVIGLHSSGEQSEIRIVATSEQGDGGNYQATGVYSSGSAQINIGDATTNKVHIEAKSSEVCKILCLSGPGRGREKSLPLVL